MMTLALVLVWSTPAFAGLAQDQEPFVEHFLLEGDFKRGAEALKTELVRQPKNDEIRFGLGVLQFAAGVERLAQGLYRFGLGNPNPHFGWAVGQLPFARLPISTNPKPDKATYQAVRQLFNRLQTDLKECEATLAGVESSSVKLRLHFGAIHVDLNGDNRHDVEEVFWRIYSRINVAAQLDAKTGQEFLISFDRADVHWLRGYCHLLMGMLDLALAVEGRELFDYCGHLFFPNTDSPMQSLDLSRRELESSIADLIAFIHLSRLPVKEPQRCKSAVEHLRAMVGQSRESWKWIRQETDDDHEWIPGPKQHSVIPNARLTEEMVTTWHHFLDEWDAILARKKLVPHWRIKDDRGINLPRALTESKTFDVILWVQGSAILPFLERGDVTQSETWERFQRVFRGEFIGFAIWFN